MALQRNIGTELYLFTQDDGVPAPHLVISAHGGFYPLPKLGPVLGPGWLRVPQGMELLFYVADAETLIDPRVDSVLSHTPVEVKQGGELTRNYMLSKFQGRHSDNAETYASLKTNLDGNRTQVDLQETMLREQGIDLSVPMDTAERVQLYEDTLAAATPADAMKLKGAWMTRRIEKYDVLTVRNRTTGPRTAIVNGVTLKEALAAVSHLGYRTIHCNFCRSSMVKECPDVAAVPGTTWDRRGNGLRNL